MLKKTRARTPKSQGFMYIIAIALIFTAFYLLYGPQELPPQKINLSTFQEQVEQKQVKKTYVSCQRHKLFFRIPISKISKINTGLLKDAMDILLRIP